MVYQISLFQQNLRINDFGIQLEIDSETFNFYLIQPCFLRLQKDQTQWLPHHGQSTARRRISSVRVTISGTDGAFKICRRQVKHVLTVDASIIASVKSHCSEFRRMISMGSCLLSVTILTPTMPQIAPKPSRETIRIQFRDRAALADWAIRQFCVAIFFCREKARQEL